MSSKNLVLDDQSNSVRDDEVAIIGMACLFPGAPDLTTYWDNIIHKVDAISDPPAESWDPNIFYDPNSTDNDRVYCKRGGFIGSMTIFDPLDNGVMPLAVQGGEPDQWLALKIARDALRDAGYGEDIPERERTAVIIGKGTYLNRGNLTAVQHGQVAEQTIEILKALHPELTAQELAQVKQELKRQLPPFSADTASGLIPNIIAGRIANRLNLMGPSYTVDAACASSLIAMEMALRELSSGQCDLALVGGAHVVTPVPVLMLFCQLGALSRGERIRPFDKNADGTILGEGLGMVVLKRLADARRDGNRVYAVVKGAGSASDGRGLSVMAPRVEGEVLALRRAYDRAGVSPRSVGLIEAHGTGTPVGDVTEVRSLTEVFGPRNGDGQWCALGSVKSMIGHVMPAAGIAGIIKTALSLYQGVLPPTLNVEEPNPLLELEQTPFYLNTEARPWIHRTHDTPRRAGVNAFGFGGINAHVILEEAPRDSSVAFQSVQTGWDSEVLILSAVSREALMQQGHMLAGYLANSNRVDLKDLAYTLNTGIDGRPSRLAIVATDADDLREKLTLALQKLSDPATKRIRDRRGIYYFDERLAEQGQIAFLFPGEGSQYVNMLSELALHFPLVREHFDAIDRVFASHARNFVPSDFVFPPPGFSDAEREAAAVRIWQIEGAVESVLTASRALHALLQHLEIKPDAVLGHSTGEYSAMLAAGMIQLDDEESIARFSLELNDIYQAAAAAGDIPQAALVAVGGSVEMLQSTLAGLEGEIYVAMDNCPHQTVIVGDLASIDSATELLARQGLICERLSFDRPYHTPLFHAYAAKLRPFLERWLATPPAGKAYSCTIPGPFSDNLQEIRQVALDHWLQPVEFRKTIEAMHADGVRIFVEVGPRGNLTAFVDDILRGQPHLAVPADIINRPGIGQLNHLVGQLAAHGVSMALDYLYRHRQPRRVSWDSPAQESDAAGASAHSMKLLTGWPPMSLSQEFASTLRTQLATSSPEVPAHNGHASHGGKPLPVPSEPAPAAIAAGSNGRAHIAANGTPPAASPPPAFTPPPDGSPAVRSSASTQVMSNHFQTMQRFLSVEGEIMEAFLGGRAAAPGQASAMPVATPVAAAPTAWVEAAPAEPAAEPVAEEPAEEPSEPVVSTEVAPETVREVLLRLVSERTGYPVEMLSLDVDLEANLGIDSIKRVEILGSFQRETGLVGPNDMEVLASRKTLGDVLAFLTEPQREDSDSAPADSRATPNMLGGSDTLPFVSRVLALDPEREFRAIYDVDLSSDRFLHDHTLGREISSVDPALTGLPVMPLTVSLEVLAEAASALAPGKRLVGMREVRAYRWITVEEDTVSLELRAWRTADGAIKAEIRDAVASPGEGEAEGPPIVEGTVLFAADYPASPPVAELVLQDQRPSVWASERLYSDGMFHGPAFRGVTSMDRWGSNGSLASLSVLPLDGPFGRRRSTQMLTDPILLDQPGQVVAFWMAEHLDKGKVIFPFRVEALHIYGPPPAAGQHATCQARIELVGDWQVRSDLDVVLGDGRLWCRIEGWWDRRFDLPDDFFRFLLSPEDVSIGRPWPNAMADVPGEQTGEMWRLGIQDFPDAFFTAHSGIWRQVMAHLILSRRERVLWRNLVSPEQRRIEWLLGRLAAKEAVRAVIGRSGLRLRPADVEILPDVAGRPVVHGTWNDTIVAPWVSISHVQGEVIALAWPDAEISGVGVDLEVAGRMNEEVEKTALTESERALIAGLPLDETWSLRLWCAKEAAGKAVGQGMVGGPRAILVDQIDPNTGRVGILLQGPLAERLAGQVPARLTVFTVRDGDAISAVAIAPAMQRDNSS